MLTFCIIYDAEGKQLTFTSYDIQYGREIRSAKTVFNAMSQRCISTIYVTTIMSHHPITKLLITLTLLQNSTGTCVSLILGANNLIELLSVHGTNIVSY